MNNNHKSNRQKKKRRDSRQEYSAYRKALERDASIKDKKDKALKASKEISKIIGCKRTRADYGDKLYDKSAESGNKLTFTPKEKL